MRLRYILLLLISWPFITVAAENFTVHWEKQYQATNGNGRIYEMVQTANSHFLLVGDVAYDGQKDGWALYLNAQGEKVWEKDFPRANNQTFNDVIATTDGFILIGNTPGEGEENLDIWVVKLDQQGNILWERTYGDKNLETGNGLATTADGGFIALSDLYVLNPNTQTTSPAMFLSKMDSQGNWTWQTFIQYGSETTSNDVLVIDNGNIFAIGHFFNANDPLKISHPLLLKLNSAGEKLWEKPLSFLKEATIRKLVKLSDQNILLVGDQRGANTQNQTINYATLAKVDTEGNLQWKQDINPEGTAPEINSYLVDAVETAQDNLLLVGRHREETSGGYLGGMLLALAASDGQIKWQNVWNKLPNSFNGVADVTKVGTDQHVLVGYQGDTTVVMQFSVQEGDDVSQQFCDANTCDYQLQMEQAGFYIANVTLPQNKQEGFWGLSVNTSKGSNPGGFNAGAILKENGDVPGFVGFYLPEAAKIEVAAYEYTGQTNQLTVRLLKAGETIYEQTQTAGVPATIDLEAGFYVAEVLSQAGTPRGRSGISLNGEKFKGGVNIGGWIDSYTGGTGQGFGAFYVAEPQTVKLKLLFGNNYGSVGADRLDLDVYLQNEDDRTLYWTNH